jgi:hypothetical protein
VFFANSGSEGVDTALKIALAYHKVRGQGGRTRLIGRERGYHGSGFGGISVGGIVNNRRFYGGSSPASIICRTPTTVLSRPLPRASRIGALIWPMIWKALSRCTVPTPLRRSSLSRWPVPRGFCHRPRAI